MKSIKLIFSIIMLTFVVNASSVEIRLPTIGSVREIGMSGKNMLNLII